MSPTGWKQSSANEHRLEIWTCAGRQLPCVAANLLSTKPQIRCGLHGPNARAQDSGSQLAFLLATCKRLADEWADSPTTICSRRARSKYCLSGITVGAALRGRPSQRNPTELACGYQ